MIDEKVIEFIKEHHLLTLATAHNNVPYCANCFYAFNQKEFRFIIASDEKTRHIKEGELNPNIAGTIALETKEIGKIRGLQFTGQISRASTKEKALYISTFPFALALNPTLWSLYVETIKFTDNRLGFGKKLEYTLN
jgi:hypothetical protein